jgi:hypothetical protein
MKFVPRALCLLMLLLGVSSTLSANGIPITLNNAGSNVMGGVYVGAYNFTLTIGSKHVPVKLICDDFNSEVYIGEKWRVKTSTFPSLSNVKWPNQKINYAKVGWLVLQMNSPANRNNAITVGNIQWAIWDIFTPGVSNHNPYGHLSMLNKTNINHWLTLAQTNYASGNYSSLVIYTPIRNSQPAYYGTPQEYFGVGTPVAPTPEPSTLLLFGTGIAALARWRRQIFS